MPIPAIEYPTFATGEPQRLGADAIAGYAAALRRQLFGLRATPIDVHALAARTGRMVVNRRPMRVAWDFEHGVHDGEGRPVLGICEHDPEAPDTVMISLNGRRLADRLQLLRSTAVHELAHAIFDMPAALGGPARKTFRSLAAEAVPSAPIDWPEWRADAFMGTFLVPPDRLARAVARQAGAMEIPFRWRTGMNGVPMPFLDIDPHSESVDWLIDALAESFGVTPAFITVRLKKGRFFGQPARANERGR